MKSIQVLSPLVANQIAAGEVVERPFSVTKELIENSLDAGASQIDVILVQGGLVSIQVQDNGHGIPKEELALSLQRHATSKVQTSEDLTQISSLGFRGEALASIVAVAKCELSSKPAHQKESWSVSVRGDTLTPYLYPGPPINGTRVEVRDLFYNTPARRKFLKSVRTEFHHMERLVKGFALANPDVAFRLVHNDKAHKFYARASFEKRCEQVLGKTFMSQHAHYLNYQASGYHLEGYISGLAGFKKSTDSQFFFINGRLIRDKVVLHAIKQGLQQLGLISESFPCYALKLTCPLQDVDINVHPTKHEVRFASPSLIHDFVQKALQLTFQSPEQPSLPEINNPVVKYKTAPIQSAPASLPNLHLNLEVFTPKTQQHGFIWEGYLFSLKPSLKITNLKRDKALIWEALFKYCQKYPAPTRICLFPVAVSIQSPLPELQALGFHIKQNVKGIWQLQEVPAFLGEDSMPAVLRSFEQTCPVTAVKAALCAQSWEVFTKHKVFQTMLEANDYPFQHHLTTQQLDKLLTKSQPELA